MWEKAANAQRKALKNLQKAWRTTAQDHLKKYKEVWKQNIKKLGLA